MFLSFEESPRDKHIDGVALRPSVSASLTSSRRRQTRSSCGWLADCSSAVPLRKGLHKVCFKNRCGNLGIRGGKRTGAYLGRCCRPPCCLLFTCRLSFALPSFLPSSRLAGRGGCLESLEESYPNLRGFRGGKHRWIIGVDHVLQCFYKCWW